MPGKSMPQLGQPPQAAGLDPAGQPAGVPMQGGEPVEESMAGMGPVTGQVQQLATKMSAGRAGFLTSRFSRRS